MKILQKVKNFAPQQLTQLTIGTLIVLAIIAGIYTGYQLIFAIPGLIGIGLIKAGLTNNCPLENQLSKICKTN